MKQRYKVYENGFTLVELLVVLVILALIVIAVPASFKGGTRVWEKGDRHAELLQNGLIGLEQIGRELKQARYFTSAESDSMQFVKQDEDHIGTSVAFGKSGTDPEYVQQDSTDLAGPIADNAGTGASALSFTYYLSFAYFVA